MEVENATLSEQKEKGQKDNTYWKDQVENHTTICSEQKANLEEIEDPKCVVGIKRKCNGEEFLVLISQASLKRNTLGTAASVKTLASRANQAED